MLVYCSTKELKSNKTPLNLTPFRAFSLYLPAFLETGVVTSTGDGVAKVYGLKNVRVGELVEVWNRNLPKTTIIPAIALNLKPDHIGIALCGNNRYVVQGCIVFRTGKLVSIPTGKFLLGRVIDALGNAVDGFLPIPQDNMMPVDVKAPGIVVRQSVHEALLTGTKMVDTMIPIGRGQRQLIIGDRCSGKTTIAIDAILNQQQIKFTHSKELVYCVYVAVGQKRSSLAHLVAKLRRNSAMHYTIVVSATASDSSALQYLAPYSGCSIGEFFRDSGFHCLAIYDDLSKHAVAYRQMALLLRRPPGREAYPGDVFYLHSRLLERAAKMHKVHKGGSLTAFPVIETLEGDVTAYIPTNVISITDGQIFIDKKVAMKGIMPAINIGISVSRIGSAALLLALKQMAARLKLELADYREIAGITSYINFEDLDPISQHILVRGIRLSELVQQWANEPVPIEATVILLYAALNGYIDVVPSIWIREFESFVYSMLYYTKYKFLLHKLEPANGVNGRLIAPAMAELVYLFLKLKVRWVAVNDIKVKFNNF